MGDIDYIYLGTNASGQDPRGAVDNAVGGSGCISVRGWAVDDDDPNYQPPIHIYVGGEAGSGANHYVIQSNKYRSDSGIGWRGFEETINITETGTFTLYFYAINNTSNSNNPLIGTKTVTVTS